MTTGRSRQRSSPPQSSFRGGGTGSNHAAQQRHAGDVGSREPDSICNRIETGRSEWEHLHRDDVTMRIIISRKGFDSSSGGIPSPILPDGTIVSFPIPEPKSAARSGVAYDELACGEWGSIGDVAEQLGAKASVLARGAHVDPDVDPAAATRRPGWRPALGQADAALSHLQNQGVGPGDLFLFFGLFRRVVERNGRLQWDGGSPPEHLVFGWLRVGSVVTPSDPGWSSLSLTHGDHPHVTHPYGATNGLLLSADQCDMAPDQRASGLHRRWCQARRLTRPNGPPSEWRLPRRCHPGEAGVEASYHGKRDRWRVEGDTVVLRTVGRGQEFVVEATPAWREWGSQILNS